MAQHEWRAVKDDIRSAVGASNYKNWIEPLVLSSLSEGVAHIQVPNAFMGDYVGKTFGDQIIYHLNRKGAQVQRLSFAVADAVAQKPAGSAKPAVANGTPAAKPSGEIQPDHRFTFDTFVVGKPNELAHAAAKRVAEGGPVTFNPLFLYGGVGLGKTHLMHAIAHELSVRQPDLNVLYISADQFIYRFISALRDRKMMDFKQMFRSVDVLMVDDIQFLAGKESTQEEFFHTFNALVDQNKQLIISADRAPGELKDVSERIRSRLQCGLVVDLHPTDYELRLGILHAKQEMYRSIYPGVEVATGVLEFLAHRISSNVRILEGALTRLFAFASLVGREVTMELAQDCLSDILRSSDRKVTIEEIQRKVSEHYAIRLSDMLGPRRPRNLARPRQIAMWLCKNMTSRSLPEIGRKFGKRDHTTIMHGIRKIEELRQTDSQIADDLEMLQRALQE
ncbi:chromosomal replication initiator protein DnaA [Salibaculum griseiflavum]|jgi:chromosomal replication initiator protein|uniref:Chromosomal replication initiator protein DnaA n=1 Tax=Salibaculum griseiflavum TaxID=1914409 RepID=A0A2V1P3N8_9RHOB|nr:chromosomal replication initiator protein DnaA [Salibaculum griseiflavum]PWG17121.1 chromosomal replication initiator protein DnaA [Salibaculum griseiflavum]